MADTFGLKIGLEGEKEFKKALAEINQSFKVLGSEMKLVESQFSKSDNSVDMAVDYNPVLPVRATSVRINIMSSPEHITPGLVNFTVFGFSEL